MELRQRLLDGLPQGAVIVRNGQAVAFNDNMVELLLTLEPTAQLERGEALPAKLELLLQQEGAEGSYLQDEMEYTFSKEQVGEEMLLLVEREPRGLDERAMTQFLRRLREQMGCASLGLEGLMEVDELGRLQKIGVLQKSHYSMVRMLEHMELLRGEYPRGKSSQMELVGYCQQLTQEIAPLMKQLGVVVEVVPKSYGLFVEGEEHSLQRLLLGLISNSIQRREETIRIVLAKSQKRCKITLCGRGREPLEFLDAKERLRRTLLAAPDSLDMATARVLAKRLAGTIMVARTGGGGENITIALPLATWNHLPVKGYDITDGQRYSQLLVELSDVLPSRLFSSREIE